MIRVKDKKGSRDVPYDSSDEGENEEDDDDEDDFFN
jgi:hypothetical protein